MTDTAPGIAFGPFELRQRRRTRRISITMEHGGAAGGETKEHRGRIGFLRRIVVPLAGLVVIVMLAGACGTSGEPDAVSDAPSATTGSQPATTESRCGDFQEDGSFDEVDCDEPHDGEFAGVVPGPGQVPEPVEIDGGDSSEVYTDFDLIRACVGPVTDLIGGPLDPFGIDVAYVTASEPGEDYEDEVECWAWSRAEDTLTMSIADEGLAAALGEHAPISSVEPGECFRYPDPDGDSFDIVTPVECDENDVEVIEMLGTVELDGDYPGAEAVSERGDDGCGDLVAESADEVDPGTVIFNYPTERSWEALGQKSVICQIDLSFAEPKSESYCLTVPDGSTQGTETDCSEPHNVELVGQGEPPEGPLPDEQVAMDVAIARVCRPVAAAALGLDVLPHYLETANPGVARPGATLTEPFDCFIKMAPDDVLTGSLLDTDPVDALGDYVVTADIEPGDCFLAIEANYNVSLPADCSDPDALMAIGAFETDEDGEFPGVDALRGTRSNECQMLLASSGLDVDPTTVSGVIPGEVEWYATGFRTITCDGKPT